MKLDQQYLKRSKISFPQNPWRRPVAQRADDGRGPWGYPICLEPDIPNDRITEDKKFSTFLH